MKTKSVIGLSQLESMRSHLMAKVGKLQAKRNAYLSKADGIGKEILAMGGVLSDTLSGSPKAKKTKAVKVAKVKVAKEKKAKAKKVKSSAVKHARTTNEKPLQVHIQEVLTGKNLKVKEIVPAVLANGFKTSNEKGLYSQISVALINHSALFVKVARGVYAVATAAVAPVVDVAPATDANATA